MPVVTIPANGWQPRAYQRAAWEYMESGGKHAELVWSRRSGKDEVALNWACTAAFERVAGYWHMLPEAAQARKAIWSAVSPHTGKRRIDEAFPHELRSFTREQEMMIGFKNGATWQVVGSDNFNSLVGSTPAGIVYSEWAIANPAAKAYLRPIIAENNGWQMFITTPRGKNHAYRSFQTAKKDPAAFTQIIKASDTGIFTPERLIKERQAYIDEYGLDVGEALFEQEYMCSFDAAILGAYYGREIQRAESEGRITDVEIDPDYPVDVCLDIGWSDDTAIWFFQVIRGEVRFVDYYAANTQPIRHYTDKLDELNYNYRRDDSGKALIWMPHDGWAQTFAANGRSSVEQFLEKGYKSRLVPNLSLQDGIQAVRKMLPNAIFDLVRCEQGIECLRLYRREYDSETKVFKDKPLHDWTSHGADSMRYAAIIYSEMVPKVSTETVWPIKDGRMNITLDQLWNQQPKSQRI